MKISRTAAILLLMPLLAAAEGSNGNKVIYGTDDRIDVYQETSLDRLAWAASTCALVDSSSVSSNGDGTFTLDTFDYTQDGFPPCDGEAFADQPVAAFCSGFLAAEDIIVTAGHCVETTSELSGIRFIFGFKMTDANTAVTTFNADQVYTGIDLIGHQLSGDFDYSVIKLDRPVTAPGAAPLPVRTSGTIAVGTSIGVIGHPAGLPMKLSFGSETAVSQSSATAYFVTNLDTYGGNSGSPVFNAETGVVEGVLVRGQNDFNIATDCFESARLDDADAGEDVSKSTTFDQFISASEGSSDGEGQSNGGPSSLFFSEYVEGTSNNKALEIYNPTDVAVDLSSWSVRLFSNGALDPSNTLALSTVAASLPAGGTIVIANSSADSTVLAVADVTSTVTFYNGDDTVCLFNGETPVDVIGVIGEDPGVNWTDGDLATNEQTLRRKATICSGNDAGFSPVTLLSAEWETLAQNTFGGLGAHSVTCTVTTEGEGVTEGTPEGEGVAEGVADGEGVLEGVVEGNTEGEGQVTGDATLFFSEYVEGTSNNKALEIYNPADFAVNLSGWSVSVFGNGAIEPGNTLDLSTVAASLAPGDTIVIANPSADAAILGVSDFTSTVTFFNGDDTVVLFNGTTAVDVFGVIGEDPGVNWTDGDLATNEQTLRRKPSVCSGNDVGFAPVTLLSAEWQTFAQNTFNGLGSHSVTCSVVSEGEGTAEGVLEGEGIQEGTVEGEGQSGSCAAPNAIFCEDFTDNFNDTIDNANDDFQEFSQVSVASSGNNANWHIYAFELNPFARVNGFGADVASNDWLISPAFNLNEYENVVLSFDSAYNFDGPDLELLISTNYNPLAKANPTSATWTSLSFTLPATGAYTWTPSGDVSLDAYSGTNVHIAWRYTSTGIASGQSSVWEVDNIVLSGDALLPEGNIDGEGSAEGIVEGTQEGIAEGEGTLEGEGSCDPLNPGVPHTVDSDENFRISLSELLRVVQLFNVGEFSCATQTATEDGFTPGAGETTCQPHNSDYGSSQDWRIDLTELLRGIQFYNAESYYQCGEQGSEDGYCIYSCVSS